MLYLSPDTTRVLLYCVEHEKSGALTGLECNLVQLPEGILLAGRRQSSIHATIKLMGVYGIIQKSVHEHMVEGSCGRERCDFDLGIMEQRIQHQKRRRVLFI